MAVYHEGARDLPIAGEYDVIVAGAGPAGVSAAVMAARMGAKTLLLEYNNCPGGISTSGLMSHWTGTVQSKLYTFDQTYARLPFSEISTSFAPLPITANRELLSNTYPVFA